MAKIQGSRRGERKRHHALHFAGKVWVFKEVLFSRDDEGELAISFAELARLHRAVANAICANDAPLTCAELDFLCELTSITNREIATILKCTPTNVSKWRKRLYVPELESLVLKEVLWEGIFGKDVEYPKASFGSERLKQMGLTAIKLKLADPVQRSAA